MRQSNDGTYQGEESVLLKRVKCQGDGELGRRKLLEAEEDTLARMKKMRHKRNLVCQGIPVAQKIRRYHELG